MPCLSAKFDPGIGLLINIVVLPPDSTPIGQLNAFPALIDTGASITCISPKVVQSANLQPIGMRPMVSATHTVPVNLYLVDIILPFGKAGLHMKAIQVMEFASDSNAPFQILVGRDIICKGVLTLSFDGHYSFSL